MNTLLMVGEQNANDLGHMTKMAAMPIYGKIVLKSPRNQSANELGT